MELKSKLSNGQTTIGSWVTLGHPAIAEIMAGAGFDWLVLDMEHSTLDVDNVQVLIQVLDSMDCPAIVRLTSNHPDQIKRVMDAGATGIMVPMVNSAEDARMAAQAAYYPPRGNRGIGLARAQGYGARFRQYCEWLQHNAVIIVMIEHVDALNAIDDILSVDEIDACIIGPYDLSGSIGHPGDFAHPEIKDAIDQILAAARRHGKPSGIHVVEPVPLDLRRHIDMGFRFLGYGLDTCFLERACRSYKTAIERP